MKIVYTPHVRKQFQKMDKTTLKRVVDYMDEIATLIDPRSRGKSLVGNLKGLWRYRVGDYRIICQIKNDQLIILVTDVDHRKHVYKKKNSTFSEN